MKKIIMLGAGGFAREVLDTIDIINTNTNDAILPIGFVYDRGEIDAGKLIHGIPVLGDLSYLKSVDFNEVQLVAAIGRPVWRRKMVERAKEFGAKFMSVIHPTVTISKWARIGEGAIMQRFCIVMPDTVIGDFFISNGFVGIGHDAVVGDFVHMNPHVVVSGGTIIGDDVFIGVRATILTCSIGKGSVIGACSLVTKDVPPERMAMGMPAKFYEMDEKKY